MHRIQVIFKAAYNRLTLKADRGAIGIGLIGVGGWGVSNAINIMRSRRYTIRGVHDKRMLHARKFSARYKAKCYEHLDDLLYSPDIQAVAVTVPNQYHADVIVAAADAGKHVFIEKPLASHPDECRRIGEYCSEKQVILQVGHQMRREPFCREIVRLFKTEEIGYPLFAQAVYTLDRRFRDDWRCDSKCCPGGSMEQLGVHLIDVLIHLFGSPLKADGWRRHTTDDSISADWAWVSMQFPRNIRAAVSTSFSSPHHMLLEIFCERGRIHTDGKAVSVLHDNGLLIKRQPKGLNGSLSQFIEFANCIEKGQKPQTGATDAAVVMDVVQAIFNDKRK